MSPLTESTRLTLAKTPGTGLDADAQAYIAAVEAADGQALEAGVKWNIDQFVRGCKADGIWTALKASCILSGARTLSGALVPLVGTAPTNVGPFVTGDYNRKTGLVGNGTSKYLDSNRASNTDPQNSFHQSVFISTVGTSGAGQYPVYIGTSGIGGNDRNIYRDQNNGVLNASFNSIGYSTGSGTAVGFTAQRRSSSNATVLRVAAANIVGTSVSIAPSSNNIGIFATPGINLSITYNNARLAFYSIGESLDLALLDTRISTLITSNALVIP
jgi:hypothetical protein